MRQIHFRLPDKHFDRSTVQVVFCKKKSIQIRFIKIVDFIANSLESTPDKVKLLG